MRVFGPHRGIALFLLVSFLSTPLAECGVTISLIAAASISEIEITSETEQPNVLDPQAEAIRQAWLKKFGPKWGLQESSQAEVVCTCTCCGDQCPMGAACCCLAPKYPVVEGDSICLRGLGCGCEPQKDVTLPLSVSWIFILDCSEHSCIETSRTTPLGKLNRHSDWIPDWEPPPPEDFS